MRKKNSYILPVLLLAMSMGLFVSGCSEIFSADIADEVPVINGPADSLFTDSKTVSFWWEEIEKVEKYEFQAVTPDFLNPTLVFDTLMVATNFNVSFATEGIYAWRMRGKNEGSETEWVERMFVIDLTAPYLPSSPNHHQDTLSATAVDSLTWSSADAPIDGTAFSVKDSVYISRANDSLTHLLEYYIPVGQPSFVELDVLNDLEGPGTYFWNVVTADRAGNRRVGVQYKFVVQ
jgi:hypothetical protein